MNLTRCIECGDLILHTGGRHPKPLDLQDPSSPHKCEPPKKRSRKRKPPPPELVERSFMRIMGNIGKEVPE